MDLRKRAVASDKGSRTESSEADRPDTHGANGQAPESPTAATKKRQAKDPRHRGRPCAHVIHTDFQESLLSPSAGPEVNYRGLLNLLGLVLVAANLRLVVENIMRYGVLVELPHSCFDLYRNWPVLMSFLQMLSLVVLGWTVERFMAPLLSDDRKTNSIHALVVLAMIVLPTCAVWSSSMTETHAVMLMLFSVAWAMKMVSFAHTCYDIRRAIAQGNFSNVCQEDVGSPRLIEEKGFPECIRLSDVIRFLALPTLCFQLHYPLLPRLRPKRLLRHVLALIFCGCLMYVLTGQYIQPLLENARKYVTMTAGPEGRILQISLIGLLERLLKLSLPNLYLWLLIFYAVFHSWLNVLGELTRFGDRRFYGDWWNAASFAEYWKKWNLPVHHWCLRHIYFPLLRRGWNRVAAGIIVFLVSGLMHELLVVVPLRMSRPTVMVTLAFLAQVPLVAVTARPFLEKEHRTIGNVLFWFAFCFSGQPAAILVYFILATDPHLDTVGSVFSLR
eukprot:TRINITY_DN28414_c0_g1_i1.p1 TRINITY_DN28414_c0_g1~~TRINITY_DN28414_c0_g1_i1.p1  ORF type:complete len:502 (+),score=53.61 TRINITY_DN28414_c0_g1_i1:67-1572(+)